MRTEENINKSATSDALRDPYAAHIFATKNFAARTFAGVRAAMQRSNPNAMTAASAREHRDAELQSKTRTSANSTANRVGEPVLRFDSRGSVAVQVAILLAVLIGLVALGSEVGFLFLKHRQMQSAADGAAVSGAIALSKGRPSDFRVEAYAVSSAGGFTNGSDGVTVTVHSPPSSGPNAGNAGAVEVIVGQPQPLGLMSLYKSGPLSVGARAVALLNINGFCILALDPNAAGALTVKNNAAISNPECGAAANSSSASALVVRNNARIDGPVHVHGGWSLQNNAELNGNPNLEYASPIADPYAGVALQPVPACTAQSGGGGGTVNLNPGHFCAGFDFSNNSTINLAAGAYYIDRRFQLGNNSTLNATGGVTVVVNDNFAFELSNNQVVRITAPTSGAYAGLAIVGKRDGRPGIENSFGNNVRAYIQGAVYFPNQILTLSNNSASGMSRCTQIIARIINIQNNVWLDNDCTLTGVSPIGDASAQLIE